MNQIKFKKNANIDDNEHIIYGTYPSERRCSSFQAVHTHTIAFRLDANKTKESKGTQSCALLYFAFSVPSSGSGLSGIKINSII